MRPARTSIAPKSCRNGQLEASFQWVFVIIAGGAFLVLSFVLFRACARGAETGAGAIEISSLASRLESLAWQRESGLNMTADGARFSCVGDVLTLSSQDASVPIEAAAVFMPPGLDGELRVVTRQLSLSAQGSPPIALGSALYGVDEGTYYILLDDGGDEYPLLAELLEGSPQLIALEASSAADEQALARDVPRTARTVVLVATGTGYITNARLARLPPGAQVLGVVFSDSQVQFYRVEGTALRAISRLGAEDAMLAAGAAISASPDAYACARERIVSRARSLTEVYDRRALSLSQEPALLACAQTLRDAHEVLAQVHAQPEYFSALLAQGRTLSSLQSSLLSRSCPVIA